MLETFFNGFIFGAVGNALVMVATVVCLFMFLARRAKSRQQNLKAECLERLRTLGT